jgi:predicted TIM-barrel fold metal-dependent hydrolase
VKVIKKSVEPIIEPSLPIIDPHHHLWFFPEASIAMVQTSDSAFSRGVVPVLQSNARYLLDEFLADLTTGHNVRATVFVDSHAMYRSSGPEAMKSVGELEFVNGVAAMAASGTFGTIQACAGIVGGANLMLGDAVEDVLKAHIRAGGGRYRGVRNSIAYDADSKILGTGKPHVLLDEKFRTGFKWLQKLGLSFDAFVLEPQLSELIDLARTFPETPIVLNHVGGPVAVASYASKRDERFSIWRDNIRILSTCENVVVKLGGLGSTLLPGFNSFMAKPLATSEHLALEWKPYIETCIEAFGASRCMFESDFPPGSGSCTYPILWNAFKRLAVGASKDERTSLFSATAARVYRLKI